MSVDVGRANATACATMVDEWVRCGVRCAVIAPGSRSTPMALALASRPEIAVHVVHDERAAGFVALGLGLDGVPAALLCTSGTAAANLHPAVVEAGLSEVPILVLTADRPPELRGVGANQATIQPGIFGPFVRMQVDAPVPGDGFAAGSVSEISDDSDAARRVAPGHAGDGTDGLRFPTATAWSTQLLFRAQGVFRIARSRSSARPLRPGVH